MEYTADELMAVVISRLIRDGENVGIGVNSPIPAAGVLLARASTAPRISLRLPGYGAEVPFIGSKEFFDFAQRGRLDVFFLSGIQIDQFGNINLHQLGRGRPPPRRFPGAFGSAVLYHVVKRVILFRTEHSPRTLVERVDYITATGQTEPGQRRPGGPDRVVTPRAVLRYDRRSGRLELESHHPGETVATVRAATGFELRVGSAEHETPSPSRAELSLLRGQVYGELDRIYPGWVAKQRPGSDAR